MAEARLRSHCPINHGLEAFGDKWSLLIVRDIVFRGKRTYGEFLASEEGFATNVLAARLARLEQEGILRRMPDSDDARKGIYRLSDKGLDLIPLLFEMMLWSAKYDANSEASRVPELLERIRTNNRALSNEMIERVRRGEPILSQYSKKKPDERRSK